MVVAAVPEAVEMVALVVDDALVVLVPMVAPVAVEADDEGELAVVLWLAAAADAVDVDVAAVILVSVILLVVLLLLLLVVICDTISFLVTQFNFEIDLVSILSIFTLPFLSLFTFLQWSVPDAAAAAIVAFDPLPAADAGPATGFTLLFLFVLLLLLFAANVPLDVLPPALLVKLAAPAGVLFASAASAVAAAGDLRRRVIWFCRTLRLDVDAGVVCFDVAAAPALLFTFDVDRRLLPRGVVVDVTFTDLRQ